MARLGENPGGPKKRAKVFADIFKAYIENAALEGKHVGPEQNRYDKHLAPTFGQMSLNEITDDALTRFKAALLENLAPQTVKHVLALMRRATNYGLRKKLWRGQSPFGREADFTMPRVDNRAERFLSKGEADALLEELTKRSTLVHDMAFLSLRTALRATEIYRLRAQDVDAASLTIFVIAKGGARTPAPADAAALALLASYARKPGELIFQRRDGEPIKETYNVFDRAVTALGLNNDVDDPRQRVRFHTLRHTAISWWAQSGRFSLQELMELARHRRVETTLRYAHLIPGGARAKLDAFNATLHGSYPGQS